VKECCGIVHVAVPIGSCDGDDGPCLIR
jgi:hypothetical protein